MLVSSLRALPPDAEELHGLRRKPDKSKSCLKTGMTSGKRPVLAGLAKWLVPTPRELFMLPGYRTLDVCGTVLKIAHQSERQSMKKFPAGQKRTGTFSNP